MSTNINISLKRENKTYKEGDILAGSVVVDTKAEARHEGVTLTLEGSVMMQLSSKNVGILEAFVSSVKPIQLISHNLEICKPGRFPAGHTEIPFEIPLKPRGANKKLYDTYHGVFISIQYMLRCDMKRSLLNKDLTKSMEIFIENKSPEKFTPAPVEFQISPETLQNVKDRRCIPKFFIQGRLDSTLCSISQPFTGMLNVEKCEAPIKSIELQLVRVETCGCAEGYSRDATEIQNIQIGEGDICRGIEIPIYMIFPRLFVCPTLHTNNFKIEFEVNLVVVFEDDHLITENFPIKLIQT